MDTVVGPKRHWHNFLSIRRRRRRRRRRIRTDKYKPKSNIKSESCLKWNREKPVPYIVSFLT